MSFPLLRLDYLSRQCVFSHLMPSELFRLSLCSKRATAIVQQQVQTTRAFYSLDLHLGTNYSIGIQYENKDTGYFHEYFSLRARSIEEKGAPERPIHSGTDCHFYFDNQLDGLKLLIDFVRFLYGNPIEILYLEEVSEVAVEALKTVNAQQEVIKYGHIYLESPVDGEHLAQVFDHLRIEELELEMSPDSGFVKNDVRAYQFKELTAYDAFWITPERLLTMNCEILNLNRAPSTNEDVNGFLKSWVLGGTPNLKSAILDVVQIDISRILEGIEFIQTEAVQENDERPYPEATPTYDPMEYRIRRRSNRRIGKIRIRIFYKNPVFCLKIE